MKINENETRLEAFMQQLKEDEKSENTIACYSVAVRRFFSDYKSVTKENMIAFKQQMMKQYSPKTAANRCIAMNRYCDYIGRPECKVRTIKTPKRTSVENVISEQEYKYLLDCLEQDEDLRTYWMIQFLAKTGARVSEFVQLERKHLTAGEAQLWTKGKIRRILIPEALIAESADYFATQPESRWLFPNCYGAQMSTRGVAGILAKTGKRYGIRPEVMHPHSFRHFYAIQFLKRNNNITLLSDLMGHESVDTTAIYLRLSAEEQKKQFSDAMNW